MITYNNLIFIAAMFLLNLCQSMLLLKFKIYNLPGKKEKELISLRIYDTNACHSTKNPWKQSCTWRRGAFVVNLKKIKMFYFRVEADSQLPGYQKWNSERNAWARTTATVNLIFIFYEIFQINWHRLSRWLKSSFGEYIFSVQKNYENWFFLTSLGVWKTLLT